MQEYLWIILLLCTIHSVYSQDTNDQNTFDVTEYGAVGNQKTDDSRVHDMPLTYTRLYTRTCMYKQTYV